MTSENDLSITSNRFDEEKFKEECGVFAVYGHSDAAALTALGLHALQHRGQEAAGIVTYKEGQFYSHRAAGHVGDNFNKQNVISELPGATAIGHNRYSTTGETLIRNIQPLFADFASGGFAIAHNGNLTNALSLRKKLVERGCLFQSTTDTEVIIHLIATGSFDTVVERTIAALKAVEGAYSIVALHNDSLIGVRDPHGVRPLVLGRFENAWVLASETCALDIIGADYSRDVEPGEMLIIGENGLKSIKPFKEKPHRLCIFEYVYFARPDSTIEKKNVYESRKNIGRELAKESMAIADIVIPVPDSGVPAALGYSEQAGIPYELGIIRNHYVGRTFIEPSDTIRHLGVKLKHNANPKVIDGKRVILVDDSIVRGTTSLKIVEMIRAAGASEVHMRIASPPTKYSCFYGVDTPTRDQLLAAKHDLSSMSKIIGVDSLAFLSIDGLYRAMGLKERNEVSPQYCDACFSGDYPISAQILGEEEQNIQLSFLKQLT